MIPANIITLVTKDSIQLSAILFGSPSSETGFIFLHGLGSSAFSHNEVLPSGEKYLSLYIHNRGHDELASLKKLNPAKEKGYDWFPGGQAHEIFSDCIYDIQAGVDYLKNLGVKKIFLVGHSTGCQKTIYYLSRLPIKNDISGAILICPMSDYSATLSTVEPSLLAKASNHARNMVKVGEPNKLLPGYLWPETLDAQRFLSLCTPDSTEEIFSYCQPDKKPELLQKVFNPLLVLLAENDEYADRPISEIAKWFSDNTNNATVQLIEGSLHSLTGKNELIQKKITNWLDAKQL